MTIVWGSYEPLNFDSNIPFYDRYTETEKARVDFDFPLSEDQVNADNYNELALRFRDVAIDFVEHVQEQGKAPSSAALRNRIYEDGNEVIGRLNTILTDKSISLEEKVFEARSVIKFVFSMYTLLAAFAAEHPEYAPFFSFSRYDFETGATTDDATGQTPTPKPPVNPTMAFGALPGGGGSTPTPSKYAGLLAAIESGQIPRPTLPLPGSGIEVPPDMDTSEPEEGGEENAEVTSKSSPMFAIGALAIAAGVLFLTLNQKRR